MLYFYTVIIPLQSPYWPMPNTDNRRELNNHLASTGHANLFQVHSTLDYFQIHQISIAFQLKLIFAFPSPQHSHLRVFKGLLFQHREYRSSPLSVVQRSTVQVSAFGLKTLHIRSVPVRITPQDLTFPTVVCDSLIESVCF